MGPTGDQEVVGSIPVMSGNVLLWRLIIKFFFYGHSLKGNNLRHQHGDMHIAATVMCSAV